MSFRHCLSGSGKRCIGNMDTTNGQNRLQKIFSCRQCGFCCQGETTVSLDASDQARMLKALELDETTVRNNYWRVSGSVVQMKTVDGHCVFYRNGCTIHQGRPWRCAQWPLVPAILHDRNSFLTIRASCPGINPEVSYQDFCRILSSHLEAHGTVHC